MMEEIKWKRFWGGLGLENAVMLRFGS